MKPGDEIKGGQFGVRFEQRGPRDRHIVIQLLSEDDENWFEVGEGFSSFWLDDLIQVLNNARTLIQAQPASADHFGFQFDRNGQPD